MFTLLNPLDKVAVVVGCHGDNDDFDVGALMMVMIRTTMMQREEENSQLWVLQYSQYCTTRLNSIYDEDG